MLATILKRFEGVCQLTNLTKILSQGICVQNIAKIDLSFRSLPRSHTQTIFLLSQSGRIFARSSKNIFMLPSTNRVLCVFTARARSQLHWDHERDQSCPSRQWVSAQLSNVRQDRRQRGQGTRSLYLSEGIFLPTSSSS